MTEKDKELVPRLKWYDSYIQNLDSVKEKKEFHKGHYSITCQNWKMDSSGIQV